MQELALKMLVGLLQNAPELALTLVSLVLAPMALKWWRGLKDERQKKMLLAGVEIVYWAVDNVTRLTPSKEDNKLAMALKMLKDQFGMGEADAAAAELALRAYHESRKNGVVMNPFGNSAAANAAPAPARARK